MKNAILATLFLAPLAFGANTVKISGMLTDDKETPVTNMIIEAYPIDQGMSSGASGPKVRTDSQGHFIFNLSSGRTPEGTAYGLKWGVYPHDDRAYYPDLSSWFYTTATAKWTEVEIQEGDTAEVNLQLKLTPKAAAIVGTVTDATTGAPVKPQFALAHASDTKNQMGGSWPSNYHILIPSNTDILLTVIANGYKPWNYSGAINLSPGQDMKLDIKMQPAPPSTQGQ